MFLRLVALIKRATLDHVAVCVWQVIGEGIHKTQGTVQTVSEQTDQVTIELDKDAEEQFARYASTIRVPLARIQPLRNEVRKLPAVSMTCCLLCVCFYPAMLDFWVSGHMDGRNSFVPGTGFRCL